MTGPEIIDRIVAHARSRCPGVRTSRGASADELAALEALIGGGLPDDYRHFVTRYGTLGFEGLEIYGLIGGNLHGEGPPNAYFMTRSGLDRGDIPVGCVVVASTGYGPVFLLDCQGTVSGTRGAVVGWSYAGSIDENLPGLDTFAAFLDAEVNETLALVADAGDGG